MLQTGSADDTTELGRLLGTLAAPGDLYCLYGELGAGKTTLVQGIARGLAVTDEYITSPTFSLVMEHAGRLTLYHLDLYRLSGPDDLEDLGFQEYPGEGVAAVEWPERAGDELPPERLDIRIEQVGESGRTIAFQAYGSRYESILEEICRSPRWSGR